MFRFGRDTRQSTTTVDRRVEFGYSVRRPDAMRRGREQQSGGLGFGRWVVRLRVTKKEQYQG
jgi:hypothetical protein